MRLSKPAGLIVLLLSLVVTAACATPAGDRSGTPSGGTTGPDSPVSNTDPTPAPRTADPSTGALLVRVADRGGKPLAGVLLEPTAPDGGGYAFPEMAFYTGPDGSYRWTGLPPGSYSVSVVIDGKPAAGPRSAAVAAGGTTELKVVIMR